MCSARLAFPGKCTQEPQCGRRSSYEVDSRLTGSFFLILLFCFSKWLPEPSRKFVCSLCYTKAVGSTQYITVFQSNLKSSLSKDKKHSSVPVSFSPILFLFLPLLFSFYLSPSFFTHYFFPPFCNFTSTAISHSSCLTVLLQE